MERLEGTKSREDIAVTIGICYLRIPCTFQAYCCRGFPADATLRAATLITRTIDLSINFSFLFYLSSCWLLLLSFPFQKDFLGGAARNRTFSGLASGAPFC